LINCSSSFYIVQKVFDEATCFNLLFIIIISILIHLITKGEMKKEIIELLKPSMNILDTLNAGKLIRKRIYQFLNDNNKCI
jgi:hypothetical protein